MENIVEFNGNIQEFETREEADEYVKKMQKESNYNYDFRQYYSREVYLKDKKL